MKLSCLAGGILLLSGFCSAFSPTTPRAFHGVGRVHIMVTQTTNALLLIRQMSDDRHEVVDDDDISQETYMMDQAHNSTLAQESEQSKQPKGGYQPIEDWHEETRNEKHVLTHLKREKARWATTFEDLGGDGI